jgi:hypothetical protein
MPINKSPAGISEFLSGSGCARGISALTAATPEDVGLPTGGWARRHYCLRDRTHGHCCGCLRPHAQICIISGASIYGKRTRRWQTTQASIFRCACSLFHVLQCARCHQRRPLPITHCQIVQHHRGHRLEKQKGCLVNLPSFEDYTYFSSNEERKHDRTKIIVGSINSTQSIIIHM